MSGWTAFRWEHDDRVACDACNVYYSTYRIELPGNIPYLYLCKTCAGRLRLTTKEIQRDIQTNAPKKVRP